MLRNLIIIGVLLGSSVLAVHAQTEEIRMERLQLDRKDKKVFSSRDSILTIYIDTLIMGNRSSLQFYGKKQVNLIVKHAELGNRVYFSGIAQKNNASDFDITIKFNQLGSLYIMANGQDATNTTKTHPNGDGGRVTLAYDPSGIVPQEQNRKAKNYLHVDVSPGGRRITPNSDIRVIRSMIASSQNGLRGMPQGQIYSGSPGKEGSAQIFPLGSPVQNEKL